MTHKLKTDPIPFQAVFCEKKKVEIRRADRAFETGDVLRLCETKHTGEEMAAGSPLVYTGREVSRAVSYILYGPTYGVPDGFCIMSLL